jgi:hypothetical protein
MLDVMGRSWVGSLEMLRVGREMLCGLGFGSPLAEWELEALDLPSLVFLPALLAFAGVQQQGQEQAQS